MARSRSRRSASGKDAPAGDLHPPAYRSPRAVMLFLAFAAGGTIVDLWTKAWAFTALHSTYPTSKVLIPDFLKISLSTNPGIVFGLTALPGWVVQVATVGAMIAVGVLFAGSARKYWGLHSALGMVLAGAIGNLYDRVFVTVALPKQPICEGHVRDFIDVTIPVVGFRWPVFNIADVLLVVGLGIIILHVLRHREKPAKE